MIAKCPCEHCGVNIEFATEEFLSGSALPCPTCGKETTLAVNRVIVQCSCQHCEGIITFTPEQDGQVVQCPHCSKETLLNSPPAPVPKLFVWQCEQQTGPFDGAEIGQMIACGEVTNQTLVCPEDGAFEWTPAMSVFLPGSTLGNALVLHTPTEAQMLERSPDDGARLHLVLNSGVELKVRAIRLYDENDLAKLNAKKAEAMKLFEGVSTGLGAIGSIGWVLAASVVIGAAEAAMSSSAATAGARLLAEAIQMEKWLRGRGVFLPVGKISNIENPLPGFWRRKYEKADKVRFNTAAGEQIEMDTSQSALIHNGDEFLTVQTEDGSIRSIRWSAVDSYACQSVTPPVLNPK